MAEITTEFRVRMAEWVELKKQLTEARKDMKILNQKEKELKEFIKTFMKEEKIDNINLKKGKVSLRTSKKKPTFSKKAVQEGLTVYFGGDEIRLEAAMTCISDTLEAEAEDKDVISLTGIKDTSDN